MAPEDAVFLSDVVPIEPACDKSGRCAARVVLHKDDLAMNRGKRRVGGTPRYERVRITDTRHALPRPAPERSAVPPEQWQTLALTVEEPSGAIFCDFVYVPEGCVTTVRCNCCGGRREWLSDFRDGDALSLERRGRAIIATLWPAFVEEHESCRPAVVEEPTLASAVTEAHSIVDEARVKS